MAVSFMDTSPSTASAICGMTVFANSFHAVGEYIGALYKATAMLVSARS